MERSNMFIRKSGMVQMLFARHQRFSVSKMCTFTGNGSKGIGDVGETTTFCGKIAFFVFFLHLANWCKRYWKAEKNYNISNDLCGLRILFAANDCTGRRWIVNYTDEQSTVAVADLPCVVSLRRRWKKFSDIQCIRTCLLGWLGNERCKCFNCCT